MRHCRIIMTELLIKVETCSEHENLHVCGGMCQESKLHLRPVCQIFRRCTCEFKFVICKNEN